MKTLLMLILMMFPQHHKEHQIVLLYDENLYNNSLTLSNVYRELLLEEINSPEIVIKQIIWETGWLKCKYCSLNSNNLIGFSYDGVHYLKFKTWKQCIKYLKEYQLKYLYENEEYYSFLIRIHWATDRNYINSLKQIKYEKMFNR